MSTDLMTEGEQLEIKLYEVAKQDSVARQRTLGKAIKFVAKLRAALATADPDEAEWISRALESWRELLRVEYRVLELGPPGTETIGSSSDEEGLGVSDLMRESAMQLEDWRDFMAMRMDSWMFLGLSATTRLGDLMAHGASWPVVFQPLISGQDLIDFFSMRARSWRFLGSRLVTRMENVIRGTALLAATFIENRDEAETEASAQIEVKGPKTKVHA